VSPVALLPSPARPARLYCTFRRFPRRFAPSRSREREGGWIRTPTDKDPCTGRRGRRDGDARTGCAEGSALVRIFKDTERSLIAKVSHAPNSVPFDFAPSGPCPRLPLLSFQSDSLMIQGCRSKLCSESRGFRGGQSILFYGVKLRSNAEVDRHVDMLSTFAFQL